MCLVLLNWCELSDLSVDTRMTFWIPLIHDCRGVLLYVDSNV